MTREIGLRAGLAGAIALLIVTAGPVAQVFAQEQIAAADAVATEAQAPAPTHG